MSVEENSKRIERKLESTMTASKSKAIPAIAIVQNIALVQDKEIA